jgi:hypothetical protein
MDRQPSVVATLPCGLHEPSLPALPPTDYGNDIGRIVVRLERNQAGLSKISMAG